MRTPTSVTTLENLGREQLSKSFFMREFLYSEISQIEGIANIPDDPDLAIEVGKRLCEDILEPIQDKFGRISIRSAYRSSAVNGRGAENNNQYGCAQNESNFSRHIWYTTLKVEQGAMASVVLTPYIPYFKRTGDWEALAWWIHDNIPAYSELEFFTKSRELLAFNIGWHKTPKKTIHGYTPHRKCLTKPGMENHSGNHKEHYTDWLAECEA